MNVEFRLNELQQRMDQLVELTKMMDIEASLQTEEGFGYAKVLTKIVLIRLEIEEIEKEKGRSGKRPLSKSIRS